MQEPENDSPITEYKLWRTQELEYNSIIEQLRIPFVEIVLRKIFIFFEILHLIYLLH